MVAAEIIGSLIHKLPDKPKHNFLKRCRGLQSQGRALTVASLFTGAASGLKCIKILTGILAATFDIHPREGLQASAVGLRPLEAVVIAGGPDERHADHSGP